MEMSYNSSIQTKAGVESIISNTFMHSSVNIQGETEEKEVKAKINNSYIIAVPNSTLEEIANAININNFSVKDTNNKNLSSSEKVATGYIFTDNEQNNSYTVIVLGDINGDAVVDATDYIKVRNRISRKTQFSEIEEIAADVITDGEIEATDYIRMRNFIARKANITVAVNKVSSMSYADIIMRAAEESGISPYSIAIKIIQEVGRQGSSSVSGNYPGYEGYYNFFNWGASDGSNAIEKGLIYAKAQGWDNQYTAIVEGAKKLADGYTSVGQNSAYFYKFDVIDDSGTGLYWHQYMTNVQDPSSQAKTLYNTYAKNNILDLALNFVIPVYKEMPNSCLLPSEIDRNAPTSYYINGTDVRLRSTPEINPENILVVLSKDEIVTLIEENSGTANNYTWAKIKRANGTEGYVANEFLTKCVI